MTKAIIVLLLGVAPAAALAQTSLSTYDDYALGNSSVSWIPSAGALYVNPAELAHVRQADLLTSINRMKRLSAMGGTIFVPGTGTFSVGSFTEGEEVAVGFGYGRTIGEFGGLGASFFAPTSGSTGAFFQLGASMHALAKGRESGLALGVMLKGVNASTSFRGGVAYWLWQGVARLQVAGESNVRGGLQGGIHVTVTDWLALEAGYSHKHPGSGGIGVRVPFGQIGIGGGREAMIVSLMLPLGETARTRDDQERWAGIQDFQDERFGPATEHFAEALRYDEFDDDARQMMATSERRRDSLVTELLTAGEEAENGGDLPGAMKAYAEAVRTFPELISEDERLSEAEARVDEYIQTTISAGDSLMAKRDLPKARKNFQLVLTIDPENGDASDRLDALDSLSQAGVQDILTRAKALQRKGLLDDAERDYNRVLAKDPGNAQARTGLASIRSRRTRSTFESLKKQLERGATIDVLKKLLELEESDRSNPDIKRTVEQCRQALHGEAEKWYRNGLQLYIREQYRAAIEVWNTVLLIEPSNYMATEYKRRAEEKRRALEKLK